MPNFYSPTGNAEVWKVQPDGYFTLQEWSELHPPVIDVPDEITLDELKEAKTAEIQGISNELFNQMQEGYTLGEIASFERQKLGAKDILAGRSTEDSAYVTAIALERAKGSSTKFTPTDLAKKIIANVVEAEQAMTSLLGYQQRLEVAVREATTKEQVEAIVWNELDVKETS